jgi:hypothetical protein
VKPDDRLPEHRLLTLMQGLPRCRLTTAKLRAAILKALEWFESHQYGVEMANLPSDAQLRRDAKSTAKVARRLTKLIDSAACPLLDFPDDLELKSLLEKLTAAADCRAVEAGLKFTSSAGINGLLRWLVSIYEEATGEPAKPPWVDRMSNEPGGPLFDFIMIAAGDALDGEGMTPGAIRERLRSLLLRSSTGGRSAKPSRRPPVTDATGASKSRVTLKLHGDAHEGQAANRRRRSLPVGTDRAGG